MLKRNNTHFRYICDMHMMLTLHFYSLILAKAPPYKCQRNWKKIGCYHDRIIPNRPYPYELVNHRDPVNHNWDGHLLDWREFPQSLHAYVSKTIFVLT